MTLANDMTAVPLRESAPARRLRLVGVPQRRRRPRLLYAIIALVGALTIGGAQMALSILTTQTSYQLSSLAQEQRELTWSKQMLYDEVAGLSSPQYLAANATALGMVINQSPSYLRLSDGAVLGTGKPSKDSSSVNALGRASVANALISDTPLVTDPEATIQGAPAESPETADGVVPQTPPPLTDGLPTPSTR
jgi:cell division protein FtsB